MKSVKSVYLLFILIILNSCDAVNIMSYSIKNKTDQIISVHNPNYSVGMFSIQKDTIIQIPPQETQVIGMSNSDIDFPWSTKNIYRQQPGLCGLELIYESGNKSLQCDKKNWKYHRRNSKLIIK